MLTFKLEYTDSSLTTLTCLNLNYMILKNSNLYYYVTNCLKNRL